MTFIVIWTFAFLLTTLNILLLILLLILILKISIRIISSTFIRRQNRLSDLVSRIHRFFIIILIFKFVSNKSFSELVFLTVFTVFLRKRFVFILNLKLNILNFVNLILLLKLLLVLLKTYLILGIKDFLAFLVTERLWELGLYFF